jgi:hypothetical protein
VKSDELGALPGGEILARGLADLAAGRQSVESLLLEIAAGRLRGDGVELPDFPPSSKAAELRLYELLCRQGLDDPYGRYNSLLRRLVSLERALERRRSSMPPGG